MPCTDTAAGALGLIKAVSDHGSAAACRAVDTLRPAMLAYQGEALGILDQCREVDQIRYRHLEGPHAGQPARAVLADHHRGPAGTLPRSPPITPESNKSHDFFKTVNLFLRNTSGADLVKIETPIQMGT